jgi:uncharacterized protein YcfJ
MKKLLIVAVSVIALSGCLTTNQQGGAVIGGITGGILGNQIGGGSGKTLATGIGVLLGAMTGSAVGQNMDRPPTIVYKETAPRSVAAPRANNRCSYIENDGVRSSCEQGLADRRREAQRAAERRAYQCSRYRKCW